MKPSSYGFVQRTIDGIKMSVKQVNITLKLNGYRNNPSILKVKTNDIKIYSCGPDWKVSVSLFLLSADLFVCIALDLVLI